MLRLCWSAWLLAFPAFSASVVKVTAGGVIHPITVEIVNSAIAQAQRENAEILLFRLNTPGGLYEATRETVQVMLESPVPVVTFVAPGGARAASAGFFLLLAGHVAAMATGTRTGAASPVQMGHEMDPVLRKKIESDASAWIRTMARQRGRDAAVAEKAVLEAKSFTEQEALEAKLIDLIVPNEAELLAKLEGRVVTVAGGKQRTLHTAGASVREYTPSLRQRLVSAVADPNLAFLLLVAGALGIYLEFTIPGAILPGVAGALLLLVGMAALSVLPITFTGVALLLLGLGLLIAEAFVTSHGVLGVGGAVAFVLGALLLVEGPPGVRISLGTALGAGLPFAAIAILLATLIVRSQRTSVSTGLDGMIGKTGVARTALQPDGKVYIHGEYWDASSPSPVVEGATVRVTGVDGLRLRVEPVT